MLFFVTLTALIKGSTLYNGALKDIMDKITGLWGLSGIALLSASVCMHWYLKIEQFEKSLNMELDKLRSNLEKLKEEFGFRQEDLAVTVNRKEKYFGN